jgi:hypothetical protein
VWAIGNPGHPNGVALVQDVYQIDLTGLSTEFASEKDELIEVPGPLASSAFEPKVCPLRRVKGCSLNALRGERGGKRLFKAQHRKLAVGAIIADK